jgi:hypothetical protein
MIWHFAHSSKGVFSNTENECEYSFWLSVTLMAKQVIKTAHSIQLPSLTMYTDQAIEVKVSEQKVVQLDQVKIEQKINSVTVDASLTLGKYIISVIFTTLHSHYETSSLISSDKVGVLEISLTDAVHWLFNSNNNGQYSQVLKSHIVSNDDCKKWLSHPRTSAIESQNNISLNEKCPVIFEQHVQYEQPRQYMQPLHSSIEKKNINALCVLIIGMAYINAVTAKPIYIHENRFKMYLTSILVNGSVIIFKIIKLQFLSYSAVSFALFKASHRSNSWLLIDDLT